jgi:hypothetical protein
MLKPSTSVALDRAASHPAAPKLPKAKPVAPKIESKVVKTPVKPIVAKVNKVREATGLYQATLFVKDNDGKTRSVSISGITGSSSDEALKNAYVALARKIKTL